MTVMDMTPHELFDLVEPQRSAGQMKSATPIYRCKKRGCHWFGTYFLRGGRVTIATPLKLSPAKAAEMGVEDRHIPGRAWLAHQMPAGEIYGCDHFVARVMGPSN